MFRAVDALFDATLRPFANSQGLVPTPPASLAAAPPAAALALSQAPGEAARSTLEK